MSKEGECVWKIRGRCAGIGTFTLNWLPPIDFVFYPQLIVRCIPQLIVC